MNRVSSVLSIGLTTTLTLIINGLFFQFPAQAWRITRSGQDLPAGQSLTIGNTDFSCGGKYGFIPKVTVENGGQTSTVFMNQPFCFPYGPGEILYDGSEVFSIPVETTSQGVQVGLRFFNPAFYLGGTSDHTEKWTLGGFIEQVPLGDGLYRKNYVFGEGGEQKTVVTPDPYGVSSSGSSGLPIGTGPYSLNTSIDSSDFTDAPTYEDFERLWQPATKNYLMQPHYGSYPGSPILNVEPIYYKLSSYVQKIGSAEKDIISSIIEGSPEATVVAQLTTPPDKSKIYTNSSDLNYLLEVEKIATPEEVATLPKLLSPLKAYDPKQIINNNTIKETLSFDKRTIQFDFAPKTSDGIPIQLGTLAKSLGYDYFNYLQIISGIPESETWWDGNGKRIAHQGKITTAKGTGAFFDSAPGGNIIYTYYPLELNSGEQLLINSPQLSPDVINLLKSKYKFWGNADTQPFYNDVPGYGGKKQGTWGTYQGHAQMHSIAMNDTPWSAKNPKNQYRLFHTLLVGVKDGGSTFHAFSNLGMKWRSNTTCLSGSFDDSCTEGISVLGASRESLPEFTTGGIEILDNSVNFDELPDNIIALLMASGGKLINTNGSEYIRDINTGSEPDREIVPEPSSVLGLIMMLGVGFIIKRERQ